MTQFKNQLRVKALSHMLPCTDVYVLCFHRVSFVMERRPVWNVSCSTLSNVSYYFLETGL